MTKKTLFFLVVGILLLVPLLTLGGRRNLSSQISKNTSSISRNEATLVAPMMQRAGSAMDFVEESTTMSKEIAPLPNSVSGDGKFTQTQERTIVKQATLSLLVNDTRKFVDQATAVVKQMNGFITSANVYESRSETGAINADLTLRVPVEKLEETIEQLKSMAAKVTTENITADDKTEQKVDLEAQIKNLQATEQQLLTIMKEAKTVEDTLKVQAQLTQTRDRIERMQANLENLVGSAQMSTIHVSVSTKEAGLPIVKPNQTSILEEAKMAVRDMISAYRELFVMALRLMILASPLIIVGLISWLVIKRKK